MDWPALGRILSIVLLIGVFSAPAAAVAQTTQPEPLVTGDAVALRPAVVSLKVVSANWPDPSSLRQFGLDAIRLERARTDEQKALAIWRWVRRLTMAAGGGVPCEPGRSYLSDPILLLNVYGDHHCDGLSRTVAAVWRKAVGLPARKLYRAGHTMADCYWVDPDGVGRFHMFDVNYGYFLYSRDGERIVTCDDIGLDFSLSAFPSRTTRPWLEKQWWMYGWIHCGWAGEVNYDGTMSLRAGEGAGRLWGNIGRPFDEGALKAGPDPDSADYPMDYGNGTFAWKEDFAGGWRDRLIVPPVNAVVRDGQLAQADPARAAEIVYRGRFPYVVADVDLSATVGGAGTIEIDTSVNTGRSWRKAWTLAADAGRTRTLKLSDVQPKHPATATPDRRGRLRPSRNTPIGRYDYLLRIRLTDGATLRELECATVIQQNYLVLPNLVPGENRITVSGRLGKGQGVRVAYLFDDADAKGKRHVAVAESLPFSYTIQAAGRRWKDVYCRSVTATAVPANGKGNRVVSAPPPAKILPDDAMPALDIRTLNGIVPDSHVLQPDKERYRTMTDQEVWAMNRGPFTPKLKTTAKYIADLSSPDEDIRRFAGAGLTVLRDPAAWDALEKVALEDATRAKYYAIQALFWTEATRVRAPKDGEWPLGRTWPVMEKILKRDPSVRFAPDARGRVEAPTYLNVSALVAALCGRARIKAAVPLISQVLLAESRKWRESRWGMIRALGRIGDPSAIPTVRRYLRGPGADTQVVAIEALAALGDRESIRRIARFLKPRGWNIRPETALRALTVLKAEGYTDQIVPLLSYWRDDCRWLAADALAVCGEPAKAVPALRAALEKEGFLLARERMQHAIRQLEAGRPPSH